MLINLAVWESIEALRAYTYAAPHLEIFRRRAEWFELHAGPSLVLWWIPAGHIPTIEESPERLKRLASEGPSPEAFTFKQSFAAAAP